MDIEREKYILNKIGYKHQPASGAGDTWKEDGRSDVALAQIKSTRNKGIRIDRKTIKDLIFHAQTVSKRSALILDYIGDSFWVGARIMDLYPIAKEIEIFRKNTCEDYKFELIGRILQHDIRDGDIVKCPSCNSEEMIRTEEDGYEEILVTFGCGYNFIFNKNFK